MRVDDLQQEREEGWVKVSARLSWEDNDRPDERIVFHVGESLADDVECNANAFLVATAIPAAKYGERRLAIEGRLDPVLYDGILTILTQLREWYDKSRITPAIEPSQGFQARLPRDPGRAGQFLSGGVDALATLRRNRLMYPADHPRSIRDGLYVFGVHPFDYRGGKICPKRFAAWELAGRRLQTFADNAGIELHCFNTNLNVLFDDEVWGDQEYFSAILLSFGHLLTRRFSDLSIACSDFLGDLEPYGSHPLIDPHYSGSNLRIHHDGTRLNRLEKVRLLSDWPEALSVLNVCVNERYSGDHVNCGYCRKCIRTKLELFLFGCLEQSRTFPDNELDPSVIAATSLRNVHDARYLNECIEPLRAAGRSDLVAAIEKCIAGYDARIRRHRALRWKMRIKKLDEKFLGGWVRKSWQAHKRHGA